MKHWLDSLYSASPDTSYEDDSMSKSFLLNDIYSSTESEDNDADDEYSMRASLFSISKLYFVLSFRYRFSL
ncbi:unnamed protein product [Anisakis simplex]|uniref:PH domain-containing protein n=2 Tax=Anisakis simplex TaxID=6269 RepID=A0A0M3JLC0_ANISI|nr:unnamed protein product [Anisakis simplex]